MHRDDSSISSDSESTRMNRFQLSPAQASVLLAEAIPNRSRSISPTGSQVRAIAVERREVRVMDRVKEDEGWTEDGVELSLEELGKVLRGDVGYVMRKRAEEGYGLENVGLPLLKSLYS